MLELISVASPALAPCAHLGACAAALDERRASVKVMTDPEEIVSFVRERNANAGIVIHTSGLSGHRAPTACAASRNKTVGHTFRVERSTAKT